MRCPFGHYILFLFFCQCGFASLGQNGLTSEHKALENKVLDVLSTAPDSARYYLDQLKKTDPKTDTDLKARILYLDAACLAREGELQKALVTIQQADEITVLDKELKASIKNFVGRISFDNDEYDASIAAYLAHLELTDPSDSTGIAITYNGLGRVYERIKDYPRAFEYFEKSIAIYEAKGDTRRAAGSLLNLGVVYYELLNYPEAEDRFRRSLKYAKDIGNDNIASIALESLGNVHKDKKEYAEAMNAYGEALALSERMNSLVGIASVSRNMGETYIRKGEPDRAIPYLERCLAMADSMKSRNYRKDAFYYLAQAHKEAGRANIAMDYMNQFNAVKDSIMSEDRNRQIADLQVRFETAEKDRQIAEQDLRIERNEAEITQKALVNRIVWFALIAAVIVSALLFFNFRQKRKLDQQRMATLKEQQKVSVMQAMISGEERERTRIAKDLHDGLNGTLATVKMYLNGLAEIAPTLQHNEKYEKARTLLDGTTNEVRRISHDLMPSVLMRDGLVEALNEYCGNINIAGALEVELISTGIDARLNGRFELTLYRIIQELMNNIIKHAQAEHVIIQLVKMDNLLQVTVEDDGVGFDPQLNTQGIGLHSIRSRVEMLEGSSDFSSKPGMGTSVHMEFDLSKAQLIPSHTTK